MAFYAFREWAIPARMGEAILAYVNGGRPVSEFLELIFLNDFVHAAGHADDENLANLPAYAAWLYNEAPSACWGNRKRMNDWITLGGLYGVKTGRGK